MPIRKHDMTLFSGDNLSEEEILSVSSMSVALLSLEYGTSMNLLREHAAEELSYLLRGDVCRLINPTRNSNLSIVPLGSRAF